MKNSLVIPAFVKEITNAINEIIIEIDGNIRPFLFISLLSFYYLNQFLQILAIPIVSLCIEYVSLCIFLAGF